MTTNAGNGHQPPPEWLDGVLPSAASAEVRAVYDDIAAHLRVPFLGPFWRALAWDPALVRSLWDAFAPLLASRAFEREAAGLRRLALIDEAVAMPTHQAFKADLVRSEIDFEMRDRIANFNHAVHYSLAKTLLAATWLRRSLAGEPGEGATKDGGAIPLGVAAGAVAVGPMQPHEERGLAARLLQEIPRAHGHPIADEYFRALARIPDYLNAAWNAIRPVVRDEPYDEKAAELVREATAAAARLPAVGNRLPGPVGEAVTGRLTGVAGYFAARHLPDVLIDAAMIKGLTDGPDRAQESMYDLSDEHDG